MGGQKRVGPAFCVTVSSVISVWNGTNPSTMTVAPPARPPVAAYSHAFWRSPSSRTTDWPLPEDDMRGLTTTGSPRPLAASPNASKVEA